MSDLMAGLMMVFLLISISFMHYIKVEQEKSEEIMNSYLELERERNQKLEQDRIERDRMRAVVTAYQSNQIALFNALEREFRFDLPRWDATIDKMTLEFRFNSPDVLFDTGEITIKPEFEAILSDFFPRYINVIKDFKENISEIRIEGHTSSIWNEKSTQEEAYFNNMELSQGRTRAVLEYIYQIPQLAGEREWIKSKFAAVGFSSSHLIYDDFGIEDQERSRRVTFKIFTNAELQIRKIIEEH